MKKKEQEDNLVFITLIIVILIAIATMVYIACYYNQPKISCSDNIKNQDETDIDCGGSCNSCQNDKSCIINADCQSDNCESGICKTLIIQPQCSDGTIVGQCNKQLFCDNGTLKPDCNLCNCDNIDVLIFSSSKLKKDSLFTPTIENWIEAIYKDTGLIADYKEIDASGWISIRNSLMQEYNSRSPNYFIILGGNNTIPLPDYNGFKGDSIFLDFNNDGIVTQNVSISRIPDYDYNSSIIVKYIQQATKLHNQGGFNIPSGSLLITTPQSNIESVFKSNNYIKIAGHGSPDYLVTGFVVNGSLLKILSSTELSLMDLTGNNPIMEIIGPCYVGRTDVTKIEGVYVPYFAMEFLKVGSTALFANTNAEGYPNELANLHSELYSGKNIGDAFFGLLYQAETSRPVGMSYSSYQVNIYGDLTLSKKT